jgi:hypothetical protein
MRYFVILTLACGSKQATGTSTATVDASATRTDIYNATLDQLVADHGDHWRNASVVFFGAEPDTLGIP